MRKAIKYLAYTICIAVLAYALYLAFDKFIRNPKAEPDLDDLEDTSYEFDDEEKCGCCFREFSGKVRAAADKQINKIRN